jgi:hypothetical protein
LFRTVGPCAQRRMDSGDREQTARCEVCSCLSIVDPVDSTFEPLRVRTSPFHDCTLLNSDEFEHRAAVGLRSSEGCGLRKTSRAGSKFIPFHLHMHMHYTIVQSCHTGYRFSLSMIVLLIHVTLACMRISHIIPFIYYCDIKHTILLQAGGLALFAPCCTQLLYFQHLGIHKV